MICENSTIIKRALAKRWRVGPLLLAMVLAAGCASQSASSPTAETTESASTSSPAATVPATTSPAATVLATTSPTVIEPTAVPTATAPPAPLPNPTPSAEPEPTATVAPTSVPTVEPTSSPVPTVTSEPVAPIAPEPPATVDLIGYRRIPDLCVTGVTVLQSAEMRFAPSPEANVVASLRAGQCGIAQLGPISNGWAPVQAWVGRALQSGYIEASVLSSGEPGTTPPFSADLVSIDSCVVDIFAPDVLNLRIAPSIEAPILDTLGPGQCRIFPTGRFDATGRWAQVSVDQTSLGGWVASSFLESRMLDYPRSPGVPDNPATFALITNQQPGPVTAATHTIRLTVPGELLAGTDGAQRQWLLGNLDQSGSIALPADLDPTTIVVTAYRPEDPYCSYTGTPEIAANGRYEVAVLGLCA